MESLLGLYESFMKISQSNPMLAGIIGVWIAGLSAYLLKELPARLYNFAHSELFTTLILSERGESYDHMFNERVQYDNFNMWVKAYELGGFSRVLGVSKFKNIWGIVPGLGLNLFVYNKRLFWYRKNEVQGSGQSHNGTKYQVNITTYGRTRIIFEEIFEQFKNIHEDEIVTEWEIRQVDGNNWWSIQPIPEKDMDKIFLNESVKEEIFGSLKAFNEQIERCKKLQTPHRLTLLLAGPTGTGKTTIIKALANYLKRHIYLMEPHDLLQSNLSRSLADWGKDGIIVIEDVDSLSSITSRGDYIDKDESSSSGKHIKLKPQFEKLRSKKSSSNMVEEAPALQSNSNSKKDESMFEMFGVAELLTGGLSKVLNNLDGIVEYHGSIIIMTTNDARSIDKAMLRPGRIDKIIHVGWLDRETIIDNVLKFFDDINLTSEELESKILIDSISGAKLSNLLKFTSTFDKFIEELNTKGHYNV